MPHMNGLLASLALIGGLLALVVVLMGVTALVIYCVSRLIDGPR
jgi:hypothetical protein